MIRRNPDEIFYSYGFDQEKSKIFYSTHKLPLPTIFQGATFPPLKSITEGNDNNNLIILKFFSFVNHNWMQHENKSIHE